LQLDVRTNPALLKLDLYCNGMRIDDSFFADDGQGRKILRTRAGLGSGLELILPHGLWTNVPVTENFTQQSPYILYREGKRLVIRRDDASRSEVATVQVSPKPSWYDRKTSNGKAMTRIGSLQGSYLGVYPAKVCEYWIEKPERTNCRFCSVGLNLGADDADGKSVDEVLEVIHAARQESGITYVDFNTGHYEGETFLDILEPYIRRVKEETNLLIGVQTPPHSDLSRYDRLKEMGVNRVSFCFEIFDPERFADVCPGKDREYGLQRYLDAVRYCAQLSDTPALMNSDFQPWVSNGEIIAGLEPPESSIAAIDWITEAGGIPTVCVFRPLEGTDYGDVAAPKTEDLVPVFARLYDRCMEKELPIGIAPNINVSLVLLPEECAWLSSNKNRYWRQRIKLSIARKLYARTLYKQLAAASNSFAALSRGAA
jgi:hypothetical protein